MKWTGFAEVYLGHCQQELKPNEIIDIEVYEKLIELDTKLGIIASEQLYLCLQYTTRCDIIKVQFHDVNKYLKTIILDNRFWSSQWKWNSETKE